jgi:adenylate cyclase
VTLPAGGADAAMDHFLKQIKIRKGLSIFLIGMTIGCSALFFSTSELSRPGDTLFTDIMFRSYPAEPESDHIIMIAIDEASLGYFASQKTYWPWPREFYALLIQYLSDHGASVIVMDMLFDTPDFDRVTINGAASDRRFIESLNSSENVILGMKSGQSHPDLPKVPFPDTTVPKFEAINCQDLPSQTLITLPHESFLNSRIQLGNTNIDTDRDGLIRSVPLISSIEGYGTMPSLALSAFISFQSAGTTIMCGSDKILAGDTHIPVSANHTYRINWYGQGGTDSAVFPYYSFQRVLRDAIGVQYQDGFEPVIDPDSFQDKIIFVGANAAGLADIKNTPVSALGDFPGMEIHAATLQNIFDGHFIKEVGLGVTALLSISLSLLFGWFFSYAKVYQSTLLLLISIISIPLISGVLFHFYQLLPPVTALIGIPVLSFTGFMSFNYLTEGREKRRVRNAFNQYVQPEVVEELMEDPDRLKLGGEKKNLTILFSDLAGFTTISESLEPEDLISILNVYLDEMSEVILNYGGTIDKYIGDAIMAFWGAPLPVNNSAEMACKSALDMTKLTQKIVANFEKPLPFELETRYGINTGDVVVGNIGSENRFSYTALGDSVNLAARLEPANKMFGTEIMISEFTRNELPDHFLCRQLDLMVVKGKTEPVKVFELIADLSDPEDHSELEELTRIYHDGLRFYYDQTWNRALQCFQSVLSIRPDDGPSALYINRIHKFRENPPGKDWQGVFTMTTK